MKKLLSIVNDNDEVIDEKPREEIHKKGMLHREINIYFVTPNGEIFFQHRAKDKDTFPDLLDATVGGHVEIGHSYKETAVKETEEETGVKINYADLIFINKIKKYSEDKITKTVNNAINSHYVYIYRGKINDLRVEAGKALGFEVWSIEKVLNIDNNDRVRFIPSILEFATTELTEFIKNLKL